MILDNLNEAQVKAVKAISGPVMVMAGAGSGKTKVLTSRVSYLIKEIGIDPKAILAVTFTNKAAREMKERIEAMTEMDVKNLWISTFHSFAAKVLRMEATKANLNKYFTIIDEDDSLKIIKEIVNALDDDSIKPAKMKKLISNKKNFEYFKIKDPSLADTFNYVNTKYTEYLAKNSLLDFDDLIIKLVELFEENKDVRLKYQKKFNYILVDEFQDTNAIQYKLIRLMTNEEENVFVVGDDFQSIYSFRGARIENINKFIDDYKPKLILLEKNYRSTTEILNLANDVIKHNKNQIEKVLYSNDVKGDKPTYARLLNDKMETFFVIDEIKKLVLSGLQYSDIAIIYRNNYLSRGFEDALVSRQIPYKLYGSLSFFSRMEIKDIIAYLRLICNTDDDFALKRIINVPKRKIGAQSVEKINNLAIEHQTSLYEAIEYLNHDDLLYRKLVNFKAMISSIKANLDNIKLTDLVDLIVVETGYKEYLEKEYDAEEAFERYSNIKEFKTAMLEAEEDEEYQTNIDKLGVFLNNLALRSDQDEDNNPNSVTLTTYHQAKGLEFGAVFLVALENEIFPSQREGIDIEEERRIFYVGVTRAKKYLYLTNSKERLYFGGRQEMSDSIFIDELDEKLYEPLSKKKEKEKRKKLIPTKKADKGHDFKVGDKVHHNTFGDGIVIMLRDGGIVDVAFAVPYGLKHLDASLGIITKIGKKEDK